LQCHSSTVLAPLIVVSGFTVPIDPHDGHAGGGNEWIELSGIERVNPTYSLLGRFAELVS